MESCWARRTQITKQAVQKCTRSEQQWSSQIYHTQKPSLKASTLMSRTKKSVHNGTSKGRLLPMRRVEFAAESALAPLWAAESGELVLGVWSSCAVQNVDAGKKHEKHWKTSKKLETQIDFGHPSGGLFFWNPTNTSRNDESSIAMLLC